MKMTVKKKKKEINLLVKTEEHLSISTQFLDWALTYGRYIIIIIQIVVLSVFFLRFKLDRDRTDLKETVSQKRALVESITDVEDEIRRVQKRLTDIKLISANQDSYSRLINFLEKNTPVETTYTLLSFSSDQVRFTAVSRDLKTFNYLLRQLQNENLLADLQLEDLKRRPDGRVECRLQARIAEKAYE